MIFRLWSLDRMLRDCLVLLNKREELKVQTIIHLFSCGGTYECWAGNYGPFGSISGAIRFLEDRGWVEDHSPGSRHLYWRRGNKRDGFVHATILPLQPIAEFPHKPEKSLSTRRGRS